MTPNPDLRGDFRAMNEATHRAARSARRSGHPQAAALTMVAAYTDMIVDGAIVDRCLAGRGHAVLSDLGRG